MPEIASRMATIDHYAAPRFTRVVKEDGAPAAGHEVLLPWDELTDFVELAEQIHIPSEVSPHEWSLRKQALREAVRRVT